MANFLDLKNNITLTSSQLITDICKPLFKLTGVIFFDFLRVYKDQGHICLTTNGEWNEYYYGKGFYKGRRHEYFNDNDASLCSLGDLKITPNIDRERLKEKKKLNHAYSFNITNVHKEYKDSFSFASHVGNFGMNEYYLSHLLVFKNFIDYFLFQTTPIIIQAEKEKFYFPETQDSLISFVNENQPENFSLKEFYQQIQLKSIPVEINNKLVYISEKETEALRGLIQGKSAKAIAKNRGVSYRTVETQLANVKQKLGCWSKAEVVDIVFSNNILRNYLLRGYFEE